MTDFLNVRSFRSNISDFVKTQMIDQGLFQTLGAWVRFLGADFQKKGICLLAPRKQMSFLTISNNSNFFKTKGTRLSAKVASKKVQNKAC